MYDVYSKEERVGSVYVDAGIVMLGDPCYTLPDSASSRNDVAKNWGDFCNALYDTKTIAPDVWEPFGEGTAIVVSSGYGDGEYPVYVTRNQEGRVMSLRVDFDEPMGEEFARWEDEDGH
jgi:uncharacterized protein (UPF0297 family)